MENTTKWCNKGRILGFSYFVFIEDYAVRGEMGNKGGVREGGRWGRREMKDDEL